MYVLFKDKNLFKIYITEEAVNQIVIFNFKTVTELFYLYFFLLSKANF